MFICCMYMLAVLYCMHAVVIECKPHPIGNIQDSYKFGMGFGTVFNMGRYQKLLIVTVFGGKSCPSFQTCSGTTRFGPIKTDGFVRSPDLRKPRLAIETKKTRNAIRSRVHRISARDHCFVPFG